MKKNTKIILGVLAIGGIAFYLLRRNAQYAKSMAASKSFAGEGDFFNASGGSQTANQFCRNHGGLSSIKTAKDGKTYAVCVDGARTSNFKSSPYNVYTF